LSSFAAGGGSVFVSVVVSAPIFALAVLVVIPEGDLLLLVSVSLLSLPSLFSCHSSPQAEDLLLLLSLSLLLSLPLLF
jgi:hypothetical protein